MGTGGLIKDHKSGFVRAFSRPASFALDIQAKIYALLEDLKEELIMDFYLLNVAGFHRSSI